MTLNCALASIALITGLLVSCDDRVRSNEQDASEVSDALDETMDHVGIECGREQCEVASESCLGCRMGGYMEPRTCVVTEDIDGMPEAECPDHFGGNAAESLKCDGPEDCGSNDICSWFDAISTSSSQCSNPLDCGDCICLNTLCHDLGDCPPCASPCDHERYPPLGFCVE